MSTDDALPSSGGGLPHRPSDVSKPDEPEPPPAHEPEVRSRRASDDPDWAGGAPNVAAGLQWLSAVHEASQDVLQASQEMWRRMNTDIQRRMNAEKQRRMEAENQAQMDAE